MKKLLWKNNTEGLLTGKRKHWRKDMRYKDILVKIFNETLHADVFAKRKKLKRWLKT